MGDIPSCLKKITKSKNHSPPSVCGIVRFCLVAFSFLFLLRPPPPSPQGPHIPHDLSSDPNASLSFASSLPGCPSPSLEHIAIKGKRQKRNKKGSKAKTRKAKCSVATSQQDCSLPPDFFPERPPPGPHLIFVNFGPD